MIPSAPTIRGIRVIRGQHGFVPFRFGPIRAEFADQLTLSPLSLGKLVNCAVLSSFAVKLLCPF